MYRTLMVGSSRIGIASFSHRQTGDQKVDPLFEFDGGPLERRGAVIEVRSLGGRVRHAPVDGRGPAWELGTDLADLVAQRDDMVELVAGDPIEMRGGVPRDVDASFGHGPHGIGMQRLRMAAGAASPDGVGGAMLEQ